MSEWSKSMNFFTIFGVASNLRDYSAGAGLFLSCSCPIAGVKGTYLKKYLIDFHEIFR